MGSYKVSLFSKKTGDFPPCLLQEGYRILKENVLLLVRASNFYSNYGFLEEWQRVPKDVFQEKK